MKQQILTQFPWPWLPAIALMIFFALFIGLLAITGLKTRQAVFATASRLPMDDGTLHEKNEHEKDDEGAGT